MEIVQRGNYLIYFDDVRVDPYVANWNVNTSLHANETTANVVMYRSDEMDKWKGYLTQVRIFGENPFTKKFTMIFEGELMNRSWNDNQSDMGKVTFQCKGFYHWLDIPIPLAIQNHEQMDASLRFIYEAQNINIDEVATLMSTEAQSQMLGKNIEEVIDNLFETLTIGYYDVAGTETAFSFANMKTRFKVMVDVLKEFREAGFLDLFAFTQATQIESFYVYLNQILTQLMFEFYQDRDGAFRIKTPSWSDALLKAQVLDASIVSDIRGADDWQNEPTRVLAIGGNTQFMGDQQTRNTLDGSGGSTLATIPMGLYIGDPQKPDEEEYYSQQVQWYRNQFGASNPLDIAGGGATGPGTSMGNIGDLQWFDNVSTMTVSSPYGMRWGRLHEGTDYPFSSDTDVFNVGTSGTVNKVGTGTSQGGYVHVTQQIGGASYEFRYYHLNKALVAKGDSVAPGQLLAKSGNTGTSTTGAHLHLEIWKNGSSINPHTYLTGMRGQMTNVGTMPIAPKGPGGVAQVDGGAAGYKAGGTGGSASAPSWLAQYKPSGWETYEVSSYNAMCPPVTINGRSFKGCTGVTATGLNVKDGTKDHRVIAVDRSRIPLHSIVEIEGLGLFNAADTGGDITGLRIDLLLNSYEAAMKFGRKNLRARVLRIGKGNGEIIQPTAVGATPTSVGGSTSGGFSSAYANVDTPKVVAGGFKRRGPGGVQDIGTEVGAGPAMEVVKKKAVKFPFSKNMHKVPKGSEHLSATINSGPAGLNPDLIAAVISGTSNWRENYSTSTHIGIMAVPLEYANTALAGHNLLAGTTAIELSSTFLADAIAHFSGKISFGLAAYHLGNLKPVEDASLGINPDDPENVKPIGALDFSKARVNLPASTLAFVDHIMVTLAEMGQGDYIENDPHISFGKGSEGEYTEIPDYGSAYKPRLSDEERKYKVNLVRVQQELIRNDSPVLQAGTNMTADELIYRYAKYNMQLHRAKTHSLDVSLTTCLPFLRVGMNAWLEPTRKNLVFYVTNISHQGAFSQGCYTSVNGGFVRDPETYQDIDESIFIGETRATSEVYGTTLSKDGMKNLKAELKAMHNKGLSSEASSLKVLNEMYSSMNLQSEYTTKWNLEYTFDGIADQIKKSYAYAPQIVKDRKAEIAKMIAASETVFLEKLMFTR